MADPDLPLIAKRVMLQLGELDKLTLVGSDLPVIDYPSSVAFGDDNLIGLLHGCGFLVVGVLPANADLLLAVDNGHRFCLVIAEGLVDDKFGAGAVNDQTD